ncbi:MAG: T9SS type A sorting domain-containing protein [Flavobacteriales bacterium]|nr:T9SS type A sorting domain-containing protein [Flavobacteriales bacterium]
MKNLFLVAFTIFVGSISTHLYGQGDECASAEVLAVNVGGCVFSTASNTGLTNSGQIPIGADCDFFSGGDMWYSVVIPPSGEVTISTTLIAGVSPPALNINAAAYSGTCGALTLISCDDNSGPGFYPEIALNETPGSTVFIQLWETNNNIQGDFSICANGVTTCTAPTVAFNETCIGNNQFEVDVFISNLGDATSVNIINDGGAAAINGVTSAGIQTVGPFALGTTPTITVEHDVDNSCDVSQQVTDVGLACENLITCGITLDQDYCYQNNDNNSFLYSSADGSPLTIDFISGTLEDGNDEIIIRNGDNGSAPILFQGSNGGDLAGLSQEASTGSIFLTVSSDVSGSCQDGSFDFGLGWDWQVSCITCTPPTADFTVVDNCPGGTFTVDVDITSLGNSSSLTISNDAGVATISGVNVTGVQSVGPFSIGVPVEIIVSSEDISDCEIVEGGLDFTCPNGDNCDNSTVLISQTTFSASQVSGNTASVTYSFEDQCSGPGNNPDPYFSFVAVASTQYIRVQTSGDFDPAIEVFDACGGSQLACINDASAGETELFWINELTPGQEYFYKVYHAGVSAPTTTAFTTAVAHIPFISLRPQDCGATDLIANSLIRSLTPDPSFLLEAYIFEFTELESPFQTYEVVSPNGANPNFYIGWFENFQYGRSYSVRVRARMFQGPNDGDYGDACTISIANEPVSFLQSEFANGFYNMCDFVKARRIFGSTNYRWVFDDGTEQLVYNSNSVSAICPLQLVDGLQLGTTYGVSVFITDAQGNESTTSLTREISMNNSVPNTEINPNFFTCGATTPLNQVFRAVEVCSVDQYTFRFTNQSQSVADIEFDRPNRVVQLSFVPGLIPGDTYQVAVRATSGGLVGDYGNECEFTLQGPAGLIEFEDEDYTLQLDKEVEMLIFPNPSDGSTIQISLTTLDSDALINLEVYDMQGKLLISERVDSYSPNYSLDLQNLANGMYILQAKLGQNILTSDKLIVD